MLIRHWCMAQVKIPDSMASLREVSPPWYHKNADSGTKGPEHSDVCSESVVSALHTLVEEETRWYTKCDLGDPNVDLDVRGKCVRYVSKHQGLCHDCVSKSLCERFSS